MACSHAKVGDFCLLQLAEKGAPGEFPLETTMSRRNDKSRLRAGAGANFRQRARPRRRFSLLTQLFIVLNLVFRRGPGAPRRPHCAARCLTGATRILPATRHGRA